jgi:histidinol-phosphate aminotransferase
MMQSFTHGGPDALGVPLFDFSTNSNACGPCPSALAAVRQADATRYPDPQYTNLKARLADFHSVDVQRVVLAASASEFIHRMSALHRGQGVYLPRHHYGDYAQAALAWGLMASDAVSARLLWACVPSSPLGQAHGDLVGLVSRLQPNQDLVLDCAYAPLRLSGEPSLNAAQRDQVWQLGTPNKALGLTGIRAAYALAPLGADTAPLHALCPSWPLGAHGVALLQAWCGAASQAWLAQSLPTLRDWKARQITLCEGLGWRCLPSDANFYCCQLGVADMSALLNRLRGQGVKLRDATSFGLPGYVRLGVLAPAAQDALALAARSVLTLPL